MSERTIKHQPPPAKKPNPTRRTIQRSAPATLVPDSPVADNPVGQRVFDPPSAVVKRPHPEHHAVAGPACYAFVARKAVSGACAMKSFQKGLFRSTGSSIASTQ